MVNICGRNIKIRTGWKTQTVNVCTEANVDGQYDYIIRLRPPFISAEMLLGQNVSSIPDLVRYIERFHRGQIEKTPSREPKLLDKNSVHRLIEGLDAICREYRY